MHQCRQLTSLYACDYKHINGTPPKITALEYTGDEYAMQPLIDSKLPTEPGNKVCQRVWRWRPVALIPDT